VALDAGEVLAVPAGRLRELVARDPTFGDLILRAYLLRRSILIGLGVGLRIVGSKYSPDTRRVRDFAARNRLPYRFLDLQADPSAEALLAQFGAGPVRRDAAGYPRRYRARTAAAQPRQRRAGRRGRAPGAE
jgi:thioredoxin reductase (NADPH)